MRDYGYLYAIMGAKKPFSADGGSHTDVFEFEAPTLRSALSQTDAAPPVVAALSDFLAERYLVKKGKIDLFSMPLLGAKPNHLRRDLVSYTFGRVGYNLMPSYEKTRLDADEAVRLIPYFGCGSSEQFFAPDFLAWLGTNGGTDAAPPNTEAVFLRTALQEEEDTRSSAFDILTEDTYFHSRVGDFEELAEFQNFVRRNPLAASLEEKLSDFFEAPITVGLRDTLRWLRGSRHPRMAWEKARGTVMQCFDRFGTENFLLPEITYYAFDTQYSPAQLLALFERNQRTASAFAERISEVLPAAVNAIWQRNNPARLASELLDFHCDYKLYDVEPYTGFVSTMMLRLGFRAAAALALQTTGLQGPLLRNRDVRKAPPFHRHIWQLVAALDDDDREETLELLERELMRYERKGLRDSSGRPLLYERIRRTYYTFQQRANLPQSGCRFVAMHTLNELWSPAKAGIWQRYPELAAKLVVFFTLNYRFFLDTGFLPDLRPRDAGRDIFVYGIWGYVTENLLVVEEVDDSGNPQVRILFVDNRDQFKQYRRSVDRRHPLGTAKYGMRFIHPVVEPACARSVGIFVEKVIHSESPPVPPEPESLLDPLDHAADVARTVAQASVDSTFESTKAVVNDLIDDVHAGAKRAISAATKRVDKVLRK